MIHLHTTSVCDPPAYTICTYAGLEIPYARKFLHYVLFANFANEAAFAKIKYRKNFAVKGMINIIIINTIDNIEYLV